MMIVRVVDVVVASVAFALCACSSTTSFVSVEERTDHTGPEMRSAVVAFLESWLVENDVEEARCRLVAEFDTARELQGAAMWPDDLKQLQPVDRVLRFPGSCRPQGNACVALADCIRPPRATSLERLFEMDEIELTRDVVVEWGSALEKYQDTQAVLVTFVLDGCGVAVGLVVAQDLSDGLKVLSIAYIVP